MVTAVQSTLSMVKDKGNHYTFTSSTYPWNKGDCTSASVRCPWENTSGFGDRGESAGGKANRKSPEQSHQGRRKRGEHDERSPSESRTNVYSFISRCTHCCPEGSYHRWGTRGQEATKDAEGARRHHHEAALGCFSKHTRTRGGSHGWRKLLQLQTGQTSAQSLEKVWILKLQVLGNGICERQEGSWDHPTRCNLCPVLSCWDEMTRSMGSEAG